LKTLWYRELDILKEIEAFHNSGYKWAEIYEKLRISRPTYYFKNPESVRRRFGDNRYLLTVGEQEINHDLAFFTHEEAYQQLCKYVGKTQTIEQPKSKQNIRTKTLVFSDTHIPFHNQQLLAQVVNEHCDADQLIINGDFLDCYSVSRFTKRKDIPFKEELTQATAVLDFLASKFPIIKITDGNHTDRVRKYFEKHVDHSMMFLVQYDILDLICSPYKNIHVVRDHYSFPNGNGEAEIGYFTRLGKDCIIGHFERSSIVPIKAAEYAYQWLANWSHMFDIKDIRLFLQGHTHRLSKYPLNSGTPVIGETGCLAAVQEYTVEAGARYTGHLNGYWIVYQDNKVTDLNASNFFIL